MQVNVKDLDTPKENDRGRGFDKLVLTKDHKKILLSQVQEHFRKRGSQATTGSSENDMDLVRGKGQGLIILLHGRSSSLRASTYITNHYQVLLESARRAQPNASPIS